MTVRNQMIIKRVMGKEIQILFSHLTKHKQTLQRQKRNQLHYKFDN
jgi:hypothetical protein